MSTRYLSNLLLTVAAGFLVVATQAFAPVTVAWLSFAIAIFGTAVGLWMLLPRMGMVQRGLGLVVGVVSVWTIVASLVFAPTTVVWLGFASAVALVALGLGGLTAHELTTERVVHSLEVEREPTAA